MNLRSAIGRVMGIFFIGYGLLILFLLASRIDRIIGGMDLLPIVNVSSTGFGVVVPDDYRLNECVTATVQFEDFEQSGEVCIQSKRLVRNGSYHYGVHCQDADLQEAVHQICMELQRRELRRRSGAN